MVLCSVHRTPCDIFDRKGSRVVRRRETSLRKTERRTPTRVRRHEPDVAQTRVASQRERCGTADGSAVHRKSSEQTFVRRKDAALILFLLFRQRRVEVLGELLLRRRRLRTD